MACALPERVVWPDLYPGPVVESDRKGDAEHMSAVVPTPMLRVACGAQRGRPGSGGRLVIAPGAVRFEFHAAAGELGLPPVIHARPPLVFVRARLLPPGFSSALILHGDEGTVTVFTWCGLRARVLRALAEAEVAFFERVTWVSIEAAERPTGAATRHREPVTH